MHKLTKKQWKDRERILAWLGNQPFQENSRSKPAVLQLEVLEVLETYCPPDVTGAGQFFTPLEASGMAYSYCCLLPASGSRIADFGAGIGHLLYHLQPYADDIALDAWEIEEECVEIGKRLFPWARWRLEIPFDNLSEIEGQYDYVVCNPPFNTRRGMYPGDQMVEGRCKTSAHIFLELCVRALKSEGMAIVFGPYNLIDGLPKKAAAWFEEHALLDYTTPVLPGDFRLTAIQVHAFRIGRRELLTAVERIEEERARLDSQGREAIYASEWTRPTVQIGNDYVMQPRLL